jgi:hypothetical protein
MLQTHMQNQPWVGDSLFRHLCLLRLLLHPGASLATLCLEIAKEEAALVETGAVQPHDMTPSILIQNGLELEEQQ